MPRRRLPLLGGGQVRHCTIPAPSRHHCPADQCRSCRSLPSPGSHAKRTAVCSVSPTVTHEFMLPALGQQLPDPAYADTAECAQMNAVSVSQQLTTPRLARVPRWVRLQYDVIPFRRQSDIIRLRVPHPRRERHGSTAPPILSRHRRAGKLRFHILLSQPPARLHMTLPYIGPSSEPCLSSFTAPSTARSRIVSGSSKEPSDRACSTTCMARCVT